MNHTLFKRTLAFSLIALLAACGGGSGGDNVKKAAQEIPLSPATEKAIASGDASEVSDVELQNGVITTINTQRKAYLAIKAKLLQLNPDGSARNDQTSLTAIHWDPSHDSAKLRSKFGYNDSLLISDASHSSTAGSTELAIIGRDDKARYLILGSSPMRTTQRFDGSVNDQMNQLLMNSLEWLSARNNFNESPLNVVIAQMSDSYYFPDRTATRNWLDTQFSDKVKYNDKGACDNEQLALCLTQDADVLIVSQVNGSEQLNPEILAAIKAAQDNGIGVMYTHNDGGITELGRVLFEHFNVSYNGDNYWSKYYLKAQDMRQHINQAPPYVRDIQAMLNTLSAQTKFNFNQCEGENCSTVTHFNRDFMNGATHVRNMMSNLDRQHINIFDHPNEYQLEKLLVLLGDRYRQQVVFPMGRDTTDANEFIQSIYADMSVYNYRSMNPVQADLGNFSRTDFSHITPVNQTVNLISKRHFRSAGVYVIPGQTVRITRTDNSPVNTKVAVNSQRAASTHWFATGNAYNRPKYLQSTQIPIANGQTLSFTSPYGGPLQIFFDANDRAVSFEIENIGLHPYWNGAEDNAEFEARLNAGEFDWAELSTSGFEVHSQLEKMRKSMTDWGSTAADMALATERYVSNLPHVLAGFEGPGIDVMAEVHDFADTNGFDVQNIDIVKHMNADQPTCG